MDPTNKIMFCSATKREFICAVIILAIFMGDQPGKRNDTNYAGENSNCGGACGLSCNWKDIFHEVPSCQDCERSLSNGAHKDQCVLCLNWNPMNAHYSEECVKQNGD